MKETLSNLINWLKGKPWYLRLVLLLAAVVALFVLTCCGTPKTVATVHNVNPNSSVTVTMTVSNSTSTDVSTDANPQIPINP